MSTNNTNERQLIRPQVKTKPKFERVESSFGIERALNADDMLNYFDSENLKTKQVLAAIGINQNRYSQITKVDVDGSDMRFENIAPPLEVYLRLLNVFPEVKPWDVATPEMVISQCGYTPEELSDICCNNEATGERWAAWYKTGKQKIPVSGYSTLIVDTLYKIHRMDVPKEMIMAIISKIRKLRVESEAYFDEEEAAFEMAHSWQLPSEKKAKAIRKELKGLLSALAIPNFFSDKSSQAQTQFITHLVIGTSDENEVIYAQLGEDSTLNKDESKALLDKIRMCIEWFKAKNERQFFYSTRQTLLELEMTLNIDQLFNELVELDEESARALTTNRLEDCHVHPKFVARTAERILCVFDWYKHESARVAPEKLGDVTEVLKNQMYERMDLMNMYEKTVGLVD